MIIFIWRFLFPLKNITNCKILIILDRKSTRLNSSHVRISYAVFCLKKKRPLLARRPEPGLPQRALRAGRHRAAGAAAQRRPRPRPRGPDHPPRPRPAPRRAALRTAT